MNPGRRPRPLRRAHGLGGRLLPAHARVRRARRGYGVLQGERERQREDKARPCTLEYPLGTLLYGLKGVPLGTLLEKRGTKRGTRVLMLVPVLSLASVRTDHVDKYGFDNLFTASLTLLAVMAMVCDIPRPHLVIL